MKKVVRIVILSILAFSFFVACKNYTADIDDYLSYWSTESSIANYTFDPSPQTDAEGARWVSSKTAVTVTFTVNNPKNFNFKMPGDVGAPADIVTFPRIRNEPDKNAAITSQPGIDYEFKKISNTKLALTYTPVFLQKHEWGRGDITPAIMLYTMDGRHFKQDLQFALKVNTPPPTITHYTVAKTKIHDVGKDAYYVLCLQIPNMDVSVPGGLLHKDIVGIEINGTSYPLSVNEAQHTFIKPEDTAFLDATDVEKLEANADDIPSGWVLYFKTDVPVKDGSAKKEYAVKLTDVKGLTSPELKASTKPNKLQKEVVTVAKGKATGTGNGTESSPIIIGTGAEGAAVMISSPTPNTTVHCMLTEVGQAPAPEQTGSPSVTVALPLNGANEKRYKLEYYTDGEGFAATARQTSYYKILLKHTVTFDSKGGSEVPAQKILHGFKISPEPAAPTAPAGYTFRNWCLDEACTTAWDFDSGTVTSDITLYAKWDPVGGVSYTVQHFQQNIDNDDYPTVPSATQTLSGTTGQLTTATANNYAGFEPLLPIEQQTIAGNGTTVVKVKYKRKLITVTFKLAGGNISGSTDDVPLSGKFGATFSAPVPTRQGYTFNDWNPAVPTPLVFPAANAEYTAQWTANTYIVKFKVDGGHGGSLKGTYNGADKTVSGSTEQQFKSVPYNSMITFTATPDSGYEVDGWTDAQQDTSDNKKASLTVQDNATVTVKFKAVGGQSQVVNTWEDLRTNVQSAADGTVIEIAQNLTYNIAAAGSNKSTITVNKNITIKSKGSTIYTLSANGKGADGEAANARIIGIFEVENGKTLTLENVILTKAEKYAVYVGHNSSLKMKNVTIKDCKTKDNAAGIYFNQGKVLTLENCIIEKCKGKGGLSSGGINIQVPTETVSIKDTTIENCEAKANGGGIHLYQGECTLENVTVNNCSALRGGGLHVKEGTLTITGGSFTKNEASGSIANGGGGAIYNGDSTVTITGCTIGGDDVGDGNSAGQGGGIFVSANATCILGAGTKISGNKAINIGGNNSNGGGIFVDKAKSGTQAGTLTINGSSSENPVIISKNTADYGGGVYNYGTATINHAEIKGNNVPHHGGGMFNAGTCTMDSVSIENNKAQNEGGGIYSNKELALKNTTVTGNEATASGGAIQIATADSVFNMLGSTVVKVDSSKNDIYLTDGALITLTGELTAMGKIARITLNSSTKNGYKAGRVVVKGGDGFNITTNYKKKFTITNKIGQSKAWKLSLSSNELKLEQ